MRGRRLLVALVAALALAGSAHPGNAQAAITAPVPILGAGGSDAGMSCSLGASLICAAGGIVDGAGHLVGGAAKAGANAVLGGISQWAAGGAAWLLREIARQVDRSTRPQIGSAWFGRQYADMRRIAIGLSLLFLLLAIAQAALRQDLQLLLRCCLVALPASLLLMFVAVTLTELALAVTDELSGAALRTAGHDARGAFSDVARVLLPTGAAAPALPGFLVFLAAIVTSLLALLVWLELVLREAAVYLALAFLPLALAAAVWPRTRHWCERLTGWLSALILAKLTIAAAFGLAGAMVAHARPGNGGFSALLAGCAVLVLAAASPWVLLRLIPFTAAGSDGLHRSQVGSAMRQAPGVGVALFLTRQGAAHGAAAAIGSHGRGRVSQWSPASARVPREDGE